ncbi:mucin-5AC-like [Topomyia yanbarensis]|uniref:mucin-5AC-like n=1 Tax=Topomyia yanbarensis TaxID=2498891 RepID=UPI00273AB62C|nr:mucin-5AC-like [Topomyia yanbarensis]
MTKKKPSPQNRIWEKERRDRLNQTFDGLSKLLPDYEPATQLSKIEILQRAIEYVEKLQNKIKASLEERDALLKKHVDELEERLQALIARNEDLAALLKKANINVPPCKHGSTGGKDNSEDKPGDATENVKTVGKPNKKASPKKKIKEKEIEQLPELTVPSTNSVIEHQATSSAEECALPTAVVVASCSPETGSVSAASCAVGTRITDCNKESTAATMVTRSISIPSTCFVMANNQIVGTLKQTSGVNVTPALLSTPIMATGVLISNNGSVLQMPLVPPQSSLLIVSNEDVRSKICLKKKTDSAKSQSRTKNAQKAKFSIKSIDVISGRIINGKIPIPPLKRTSRTLVKAKKEARKKRRKRKIADPKENDESTAKKRKVDESELLKQSKTEMTDCTPQKTTEELQQKNSASQAVDEVQTTEITTTETVMDDQANSLDMNLDQTDLSSDLFANLQVPDAESGENQGSLSPTAAYLMNFPLVATGGGKIAGSQAYTSGEAEIPDVETDKKVTSLQTNDNNLLLDNFSSYFSSSVYGGMESVGPVVSESVTTSTATSTSFSTIYQSIDSMLDHKTSRTKNTSDCRFNTTPFTFTLTPSSTTATTQASFDYRHCSTSSYYYPTSVTTAKPIDEYGLLKPPIVSEFTFSLTSTTPSAPKTVQSQYTNSTIYSSTMTTPSYSTYGYQSKNTNKAASYTANYIPETSKSDTKTPKKYDFLETEKPATSFTFCLTSTTKTLPKYTQSSVATPSVACAIQSAITTISSYSKVEDCLYKTAKPTTHGHQPYKTPSKQKLVHSYPIVSSSHTTYQSQSSSYQQSKYDVNWMASQDPKPTPSQDYSQLLPVLDFNSTPSHSYQTTNIDLSRKSDIFFAHPTGEENLVTWSPNKLTNILNDTTSSYYPPTTVSLPNLNGDLALNSITSNCQQPATAKSSAQNRKVNDSSSTFLSVQQLVDQPRKNSNKNYFSCNSYPPNQKPLQNNYSAEALIAAPSNNSTKKDKYSNDQAYNSYNAYVTDTNSATGLSFNFDYSSDYNKNYNYNCQQNYMTSFMDNSYGLPTLPAVTTSSAGTNYSSYGYSSEKKQQSNSYYQNSSYQVASSSDIPYYVPSSEKRAASSKSKKYPKQPPTSSSDYSSHPATSNPSYFPAILPPPPPSLADDTLCYNNFNFNPSVTAKSAATSCYSQPYHNAAVPNYSFGTGATGSAAAQSYPTQAGASNTASVGSSLTNFNLSTICPEINEKSTRASGPPSVAVGTAVRQAITGGSGW